nr:MAG TPA: hypothetical protein [Caudoviricetes sp.]
MDISDLSGHLVHEILTSFHCRFSFTKILILDKQLLAKTIRDLFKRKNRLVKRAPVVDIIPSIFFRVANLMTVIDCSVIHYRITTNAANTVEILYFAYTPHCSAVTVPAFIVRNIQRIKTFKDFITFTSPFHANISFSKTYLLFLDDINIIKAVPIVINNGLCFLEITAKIVNLPCILNIAIVVLCRCDIPRSKSFIHDIPFHAFYSPLLRVLAKTQTTLFTGQTSECVTVRTVDILTIPTVRVFFLLLCKEFLCIF